MQSYTLNGVSLYNDDVENLYDRWETPTVIISDGAYGLKLFPGDPAYVEEVPAWYEPHIKKWSQHATPMTTLWFWNREIGWAYVHPLLEKYGWEFVSCNIWDKGIGHAAGNTNTKTLSHFPIVTEVCVQYVKKPIFRSGNKILGMKQWLRSEWERTGLPISKTNEACGVKNAATRKYFTKDHLFYPPPPNVFEKLVAYANKYGKGSDKPFYSLDGVLPATKNDWEKMKAKFYCELGITNVWSTPPLNGTERIKLKKGGKSLHPNQKPLLLNELTIRVSSEVNDVVWEPFGGLCSAAIASYNLKRKCFSAEINPKLFEYSVERLKKNATKTLSSRSSQDHSSTSPQGIRTTRLGSYIPLENDKRVT